MKILRTPDSCFENLPGYDFAPHYTCVTDDDGTELRIHHIDEGPRDAAPIVLMHGNPTWSYLHRKMIPGLLKTGSRVISVDLVGCGRSDKPASKDDYTQARHVDWMRKWFLANELSNITLFCQDWGGTIGLIIVSMLPERFARVVTANTGVPQGEGETDFMKMWVGMMKNATEFPWPMVPQGMSSSPTEAEIAAYRAPFPSSDYEAGICKFPVLIAVQPDNPGVPMNKEAWARLGTFEKPFLTLFGALDPVALGFEKRFQAWIPGAAGQPHAIIANANHFIQEDAPDELVSRISAWMA
jgi:haloalkane dehalogenase